MCRNLLISKANYVFTKNLGGTVHWGADWTTCISGKRSAPSKSASVLYQFLHVAYLRRNTSVIFFCPRYRVGPHWTLGCSHEQHRYSWWAIACKTSQKWPEILGSQVHRNSTLRTGQIRGSNCVLYCVKIACQRGWYRFSKFEPTLFLAQN